jgi:peptidyl-tRNA hydrolase, PTH1 family
MKLIVGLGNPGEHYRGTRHNIGAAVAREFCAQNRLVLKKGIFASSSCAKTRFDSGEALVAIPLAYMNCSGPAVSSLVRRHRVALNDLLVVHDDIDLEFGRIKARSGGSAGGHNGLKSVIAALRSEEFDRLRIGVGRPPRGMDPADFVLSPFTAEEQKEIGETVTAACSAMEAWLRGGISKTMNVFNR